MKERFESLVDHLVTGGFFLQEAVEILERTMIQRALERAKGNHCAASKALGIHRNTMQRKVAQYGLEEVRTRRRKAG